MKDALERCNKELLKLQSDIVITAIDFNYALHREEAVQIICYPEGCVYELSSDSDFYKFIRDVIMVKEFALHRSKSIISTDDNIKESEEIKMPNTDDEAVQTISNMIVSIKLNPTCWKTVILVCVHGSRDNRCGRAGPQVVEELDNQLLQRSITKESITVAGCSHIGGHKYAGVLIVYPQGDWYGMISKRNVSDLLDHIVAGKKYLKGWRGNESLTW